MSDWHLRSERREALFRRADLCAGVLREARRLIEAEMFGQALGRMLFRANDLLDEMDEGLVVLEPRSERGAFARAAELHRVLEELQSRLPSQYRSRQRRVHLDRAVTPGSSAETGDGARPIHDSFGPDVRQ